MKLCYSPLSNYRAVDAWFDAHASDSEARAVRHELYARLNRINALYMIQRAGSGHIGSSFSVMDIVTYLMLEHPEAVVFSSKGHDVPAFYAMMIAQERLPFEMLHRLRRLGGLPGHPEASVTGFPVSTGSLGMGISKAKGIIRANRLAGFHQRVYCIMGDGEMQEGQVWESLIGARIDRMSELCVIIDRNGYQSDQPTRAFDWFGQASVLAQRATAGNGHRYAELVAAGRLYDRRKWEKDEAVWPSFRFWEADTVKGHGANGLEPRNAADSAGNYSHHSGALAADEYDTIIKALTDMPMNIATFTGMEPLRFESVEWEPTPKDSTGRQLVAGYAAELERIMRADSKVIAFDADLSTDHGLEPIRLGLPGQFVECGIAEQDMVSQAGAMALRGYTPVVHSFAAFLTRRANEQIYDNCQQGSRVVYVGSLAGLLPDGPGPSHEAYDDVALMRTMPGMTILEPRTPEDAAAAIRYAVTQARGPVYIRLVANGLERIRL